MGRDFMEDIVESGVKHDVEKYWKKVCQEYEEERASDGVFSGGNPMMKCSLVHIDRVFSSEKEAKNYIRENHCEDEPAWAVRFIPKVSKPDTLNQVGSKRKCDSEYVKVSKVMKPLKQQPLEQKTEKIEDKDRLLAATTEKDKKKASGKNPEKIEEKPPSVGMKPKYHTFIGGWEHISSFW